MPRLDNSDPVVIKYFCLRYDEEDPGKTDPVDVCDYCYEDLGDFEKIDHPPYEEQDPPYRCFECEAVLTSEDD